MSQAPFITTLKVDHVSYLGNVYLDEKRSSWNFDMRYHRPSIIQHIPESFFLSSRKLREKGQAKRCRLSLNSMSEKPPCRLLENDTSLCRRLLNNLRGGGSDVYGDKFDVRSSELSSISYPHPPPPTIGDGPQMERNNNSDNLLRGDGRKDQISISRDGLDPRARSAEPSYQITSPMPPPPPPNEASSKSDEVNDYGQNKKFSPIATIHYGDKKTQSEHVNHYITSDFGLDSEARSDPLKEHGTEDRNPDTFTGSANSQQETRINELSNDVYNGNSLRNENFFDSYHENTHQENTRSLQSGYWEQDGFYYQPQQQERYSYEQIPAYGNGYDNGDLHSSVPQGIQQFEDGTSSGESFMEGGGDDRRMMELKYAIVKLQNDLGKSDEQYLNATKTCERYQALYFALKQEQELQSDELRLSEIHKSQMELNLIELKEKCDLLEQVKSDMTNQIDELTSKCATYEENIQNQTSQFKELEEKHATTLGEMEELATTIEKNRLSVEDEQRNELLRLKRREKMLMKLKGQAGHGDKYHKSLFSTMWNFFFGGDTNESHTAEDESDDEDDIESELGLEKGQRLAQKTLLSALEQSRDDVEELEMIVEQLEANCTALGEQLLSKSELIDELHDRISVFEEDKVVLKAALKQLRKEMRVEEIKRSELHQNYQQLQLELEESFEDQKRLEDRHDKDVAELHVKMASQKETIEEQLKTLLEIEGYVDKLEARLVVLSQHRQQQQQHSKGSEKDEPSFLNTSQYDSNATMINKMVQERLEKEVSDLNGKHLEEMEVLRHIITTLQAEVEQVNVDRTCLEGEYLELKSRSESKSSLFDDPDEKNSEQHSTYGHSQATKHETEEGGSDDYDEEESDEDEDETDDDGDESFSDDNSTNAPPPITSSGNGMEQNVRDQGLDEHRKLEDNVSTPNVAGNRIIQQNSNEAPSCFGNVEEVKSVNSNSSIRVQPGGDGMAQTIAAKPSQQIKLLMSAGDGTQLTSSLKCANKAVVTARAATKTFAMTSSDRFRQVIEFSTSEDGRQMRVVQPVRFARKSFSRLTGRHGFFGNKPNKRHLPERADSDSCVNSRWTGGQRSE